MALNLVRVDTLWPHTDLARGCAISPDGTLLATGSDDKSLCITNIATQEKVYTVKCDDKVHNVAWSVDGTRLVAVTEDGRVIVVTNNNAHSTVYKINQVLWGCAFSPSGIIAVGGRDQEVTLLDSSNNYQVVKKITGMSHIIQHVAFSPDGNLLAIGCNHGHFYIYGQTNGKWRKRADNKECHFYATTSLCFSPSGRMLLVANDDMIASIWNFPSGSIGPIKTTTPHVTFEDHSLGLAGGAFLGDESHVITLDFNGFLYIWRISDGVRTAKLKIGDCDTWSLSYHAASGTLALGGREDGQVHIWHYPEDSLLLQGPLPSQTYARQRMGVAKAQARYIQATLDKADDNIRQRLSREKELKASIGKLETQLESDKRELAGLQTAEFRKYHVMSERHSSLLSMIHMCAQIFASLADCISVSGLNDLRADIFNEWLFDIGMRKLQPVLKDIDGGTLTMLTVGDVMEHDVTFNDAAALLLHGYIAHYKLSDNRAFPPPPDTVLSWNEEQTANWIKTLGDAYSGLATAGWNGPALCSLSPPRVIEASKGTLKAAEAVKFIGIVRQMRIETDGNKAAWVSKWNGSIPIDCQVYS